MNVSVRQVKYFTPFVEFLNANGVLFSDARNRPGLLLRASSGQLYGGSVSTEAAARHNAAYMPGGCYTIRE